MKYAKALCATLLFVAVLLGVYYVHVRFAQVDVILYSAMLDAAIATAVALAITAAWPALRVFTAFERTLLAAVWLLAGYAFAISIPAVIDRSLSFYILEKLQQRGGGIQQAQFEKVFTEEYVKEHRLVDIRLTEQAASGTIRVENGCVKLTERGERLATFSRFFRLHFLPRERLVAGRYTDDLVDPFRDSPERKDYLCK
jgi:hypothetical protein